MNEKKMNLYGIFSSRLTSMNLSPGLQRSIWEINERVSKAEMETNFPKLQSVLGLR